MDSDLPAKKKYTIALHDIYPVYTDQWFIALATSTAPQGLPSRIHGLYITGDAIKARLIGEKIAAAIETILNETSDD